MKKRFCVLWLAIGAAPALGAELLTMPLPPLPPNQQVRMDELTLPPGSAAPAHRHDAYVYVYVVAGTVEMQVAGKPVQRLTAGQTFTETPNDVHTIMRNPSEMEPARFVSFIIKNADAPVSVPANPSGG